MNNPEPVAFFSFEALVYDDGESETKTETGIIAGNNFAEATSKLEKYYGDELESLKVTWITNEFPLMVNKETLEEIIKNST